MKLKLNHLLLFFSILVFFSCSKDLVQSNELTLSESIMKIDPTLADEVSYLNDGVETRKKSKATFNTLNAALECTGLDVAVFDGVKTVYAPTDAAFAALDLNADNICALESEALESILLYHVAGFDFDPEERGCIEMLNGDIAQATKVRSNRFINDSEIESFWVQASKDYKVRVYSIDAVLMPSSDNIATAASKTSMFSVLYDAVLAADPSIAAALSNEAAIYTVFAPTNSAFINLLEDFGLASLEELVNLIGVDNLSTVLLYHVASACAFSNNLVDGQEISTLQGETLKVDLGNLQILDKTSVPANLDGGNLDILTSNGIIHTIDKVLLPQEILDAIWTN